VRIRQGCPGWSWLPSALDVVPAAATSAWSWAAAGSGVRAAAPPHPHRGRWIAVIRLTPRFATSGLPCGPVVDPRRVNQARGAESVPGMRLGKRRLDDRTTEWTAARHLPTNARNRIPLRNRNSSAWIRTRDLTIMSRAPPCERRTQAGRGGGEIPAKRPVQQDAGLPGGPARFRARGPVVDPGRGGAKDLQAGRWAGLAAKVSGDLAPSPLVGGTDSSAQMGRPD
jgi:hypothetical protein